MLRNNSLKTRTKKAFKTRPFKSALRKAGITVRKVVNKKFDMPYINIIAAALLKTSNTRSFKTGVKKRVENENEHTNLIKQFCNFARLPKKSDLTSNRKYQIYSAAAKISIGEKRELRNKAGTAELTRTATKNVSKNVLPATKSVN
jgi:hypothetical protein